MGVWDEQQAHLEGHRAQVSEVKFEQVGRSMICELCMKWIQVSSTQLTLTWCLVVSHPCGYELLCKGIHHCGVWVVGTQVVASK